MVFWTTNRRGPIVLINHALTGNSSVSGSKGWWNSIVGDKKLIDTSYFTVLACNFPGNSTTAKLIDNYKV